MNRTRIAIARFCIRAGRFIQSLGTVIMRPRDLVGFSQHNYSESKTICSFSNADWVASGLNQNEKETLNKFSLANKRVLVLGVGGGREAISMAKKGCRVVGVDFIPEMIGQLKENAKRHHVEIEGVVQDISQLDFPEATFDLVWLCTNMYSCIPTRKRRISLARRIAKALDPTGYFVCHFYLDPSKRNSRLSFFMSKTIAWFTFGNVSFERGDMLWRNREFLHAFSSFQEVEAEMSQAGFSLHFKPLEAEPNSFAIFKKNLKGMVQDGI